MAIIPPGREKRFAGSLAYFPLRDALRALQSSSFKFNISKEAPKQKTPRFHPSTSNKHPRGLVLLTKLGL